MGTETDSPIMGSADDFYKAAEESELAEQPDTEAVTEGDDQEAAAKEAETDDQPEELEGESEESEDGEGDQDDTEDQDEELVYLELDGKEVDLNEVRKWRDEGLMQADYTRKTTELAEERKSLQAEREEFESKKANLSDMTAELQALVAEDSALNLEELREDDPEEYIVVKERLDKRKAMVEKLKSEQNSQPAVSDDEIAAEQQALIAANPSWLDKDNKPTAVFEADQKLLNSYFQANGFTQEDVSGMVRARYLNTVLKAAKFDELQGKAGTIKSKAKKATLVTKPKKTAPKPKPRSAADVMYDQ